jgi:two-component system, chemotaxis family, protein-glutamate methylesterase/glutaminase
MTLRSGATPARDVVAAGASAGGVKALASFVAGLPADLPAAVLVVTHLPETGQSGLASILDRSGPLPAAPARDGELVRPGRIYVGVNDKHLLVQRDRILLSDAPRQNRSRPSVDALLRSAARWFGPHAVGVVLSGALDDGASGLAAIAAAGGVPVVQDPSDALVPGMPSAALTVVPEAVVCRAAQLGAEVGRLLTHRVLEPAAPAPSTDLVRETEMMERVGTTHSPAPGEPVPVSCPDCSGGMTAVSTRTAVHYLCHVGHSWSPQTLAAAQREKIEQALWTAVSILEEQAAVYRGIADNATGPGATLTIRHHLATADEAMRAAGVIRKHFPDLLPRSPDGAAPQITDG